MNENTDNDEQDNKKGNAASPTAVTIDLDALDSTKALGKKELIFYDECQRMVDNIRKKARSNIKKIKSKNSSVHNNVDADSQSTPNCFFIDGPRGSGKSTLMRAVRQELVQTDNAAADGIPVKLYALADVDPTELGKGENFFIYLLGKIYELLDETSKRNDNNDNTTGLIRNALDGLRDMSSGLQILMDSEEVLKNDDTPEFFLENCLEKCADSSTMRKKLSSLIDVLATIVKQDVFLVTIDDADLNFSKCEDVLEYIRKYMHSPRLIFLFAGDLQLYSQIVRGMQLHNFHEKQLRYDAKRKENRYQLLDSMEEQYMLKLFPVDNRIHTSSLITIVDGSRQIIIQISNTAIENKHEELDIRSALATYLKIKTEPSDIDTILLLPLRSVLFLLYYLVKNPYGSNTPEAALYTWKGIQDVFQQALIDNNIDYSKIIGTKDVWILQKAVLEYYAKNDHWNADLSMNTYEGDDRAKQVALSLGSAVSQTTMSLGAKLRYWCACFPLWQRIREEHISSGIDKNTRNLLESSLKQSKEQYGSLWANLACAAMAPSISEEFLFSRGTICILNDDCSQDNEKGQDARIGFLTLSETITKEENNSAQEDMLAHAALSASLCRIDDSMNSCFYLSVYHLLMYIAEWLDFGQRLLMQQNLSNRLNDKNSSEEDIRNSIREELSKPIIAPNTPRIRTAGPMGTGTLARNDLHPVNTDSNREYFSSTARNAFVYSWQPSDSTITKLYDWIKKYAALSYISSPADYYRAWESFKAKCIEHTYSYVAEYSSGKNCPDCSSIFSAYLDATAHAMIFLSDQTQTASEKTNRNPEEDMPTLKSCILDFPLWKSLKEYIDPEGNAKNILKKARIGHFVNQKRKQICRNYKFLYESKLARVSHLEKELNESQLKIAAARQEFDKAKIMQDEKESKLMRIRETIFEISKKRDENASRSKELSESVQLSKQLIKKLQISEKELQAYSNEARNLSPATIRASQIKLRKIQSDISTETIKLKSVIRERLTIDRELSEQKQRLEEFFQLEFSTSVDAETARIKCEAAQTHVIETHTFLDSTSKDLENARKVCKQAEDAYKKFKISTPDE